MRHRSLALVVLCLGGSVATAAKPAMVANDARRQIKGGNTPAVEVSARKGAVVTKLQHADRHPDYSLDHGLSDGKPVGIHEFRGGKHNIFKVEGKAGDDVVLNLHLPVSAHVEMRYIRAPRTEDEWRAQRQERIAQRLALAKHFAGNTTFGVEIRHANGRTEYQKVKARGLVTTHPIKLKMTSGGVRIAAYPLESGGLGTNPDGRTVDLVLSPTR